MSSIEAKPTEYKGTLYRSRLEARWAVYLDHHHTVQKFVYEPEQALADFYIVETSTPIQLFLQIKPALPTQEYLQELSLAAKGTPLPFVLAVGSFYKDEEPVIYDMKSNAKVVQGYRLRNTLLRDVLASLAAREYRFDLAKPEAPRKGRKYAAPPKASPRKKRKRWGT